MKILRELVASALMVGLLSWPALADNGSSRMPNTNGQYLPSQMAWCWANPWQPSYNNRVTLILVPQPNIPNVYLWTTDDAMIDFAKDACAWGLPLWIKVNANGTWEAIYKALPID